MHGELTEAAMERVGNPGARPLQPISASVSSRHCQQPEACCFSQSRDISLVFIPVGRLCGHLLSRLSFAESEDLLRFEAA